MPPCPRHFATATRKCTVQYDYVVAGYLWIRIRIRIRSRHVQYSVLDTQYSATSDGVLARELHTQAMYLSTSPSTSLIVHRQARPSPSPCSSPSPATWPLASAPVPARVPRPHTPAKSPPGAICTHTHPTALTARTLALPAEDPGSRTAAGQSSVSGRATPSLSSSAGLSGDSVQSACSRAECKLGWTPALDPALDSWILPCHGTVERSGLRSVVALKR